MLNSAKKCKCFFKPLFKPPFKPPFSQLLALLTFCHYVTLKKSSSSKADNGNRWCYGVRLS